MNRLVGRALPIFAFRHIARALAVKQRIVLLSSPSQCNIFCRIVGIHAVTINFDFAPSDIDFVFAISARSFVVLNAFARACIWQENFAWAYLTIMKLFDFITVRRRTASLTRNRFVVVGANVALSVLEAVPTCDAALLISSARAILPLAVAPATVTFVLALLVFYRSLLSAFARRLDVSVCASDISSWVASSATTRALSCEGVSLRTYFYLILDRSCLAYLLPRTNNPSERVQARALALAGLLRLLVHRHGQVRTEFGIDGSAIFDGMRIVGRSWIETHANWLFHSNASSTCRRALRNDETIINQHIKAGMGANRSLEKTSRQQLSLFTWRIRDREGEIMYKSWFVFILVST